MSYLMDTNILLEVMLSGTKKEECRNFLKQVYSGRIRAILTDFSLYSLMLILARHRKYSEIRRFLSSLTAYKGLAIYNCTLDNKINCIDMVKDNMLDVDDSLQYSAALSLGTKAIVSFDTHFDGLKIPRQEPAEVLQNMP